MTEQELTALNVPPEAVAKILAEQTTTSAKMETLNTAITNKTAELKTANDTIKGFEGVDVADLKSKIAKYGTDIAALQDTHAKELTKTKLFHGVRNKLVAANAKDPDDLMKLLDMGKLSLGDNDVVVGFDDIIRPFIETKPHYFGEAQKGGTGTVGNWARKPNESPKEQSLGERLGAQASQAPIKNPYFK